VHLTVAFYYISISYSKREAFRLMFIKSAEVSAEIKSQLAVIIFYSGQFVIDQLGSMCR
jgi:hypothetical protein